MNTTSRVVLGAVAATTAAGIALMTTFGGASSASATETGPGGGLAADAKIPGTDKPVPSWVGALVEKSAGTCPQVTASLLAAQLFQESGFATHLTSPRGAQGIAQFMPDTWAQHGVDGDGDGIKDVWNPKDAVPAQAAYLCILAKEVKKVPGDSTDNMLAAYNAGGPAVIRYQGVPPYSETRQYVKRIRELATLWSTPINPNVPAGSGATKAIFAAKQALGTWYQWGGDCRAPFTGQNGCDCSSLTKMAWAAAGVNLPRVTYDQVKAGTAVKSVAQLQPGDLLFTVPGRMGPEHVGMYIGNNEVIDAPHTGAMVRIKPLSYWTPQIIAMRHVV
ncbi:C40 family peptidase [Streptomyces cinereoruber]|uniref:C40 family peptidase n=1 Tax=Streptomyces cinereoruber TaxID=67260 RepID=UPI00362C7759